MLSGVISSRSKARRAHLITPREAVQQAPMLPASHENTAQCPHLGGREEQTCAHIEMTNFYVLATEPTLVYFYLIICS